MRVTTLFLLLCFSSYRHTEAIRSSKLDTTEEDWKVGDSKCGTNHNRRIRRHDRDIFPRRPPSGNKYGTALEFEQGQIIRYQKLKNPSKRFTVDFWMKPEGGQQNLTVVLGVFDRCLPDNETRGWFIGMREAAVKSDLRITFTLHTASASRNTTIMSHRKVQVGRWIHVAATYDGRRMKLFVNQAKVAVGRGQKGIIFDMNTQGQACDSLEIGGDRRNGYYYRGQIDKLRLWSDALAHNEVTASSPDNTLDHLKEKILMYDDFDDENSKRRNWIPVKAKKTPRFVRSTVPEDKHDLSIRRPPCGVTICDNPEVVRSYLKHPNLRGHKRLKIRVINVMDDDMTRPTLTEDMVRTQHQVIRDAFAPHNISWDLEVVPIKNSWLRGKTVLDDCEPLQIGDGTCNLNCRHDVTGDDGGDCTSMPACIPEKKGNGECNPECNNVYYGWDDGDCCNEVSTTHCLDPKSPNRAYISIKEYKKRIGLTNRDGLNVYVVNIGNKKLEGIATFPWLKEVYGETGGVLLSLRHFHKPKVLVHELGHVLGLYHVHHGSEDGMPCANDCFESFPSLELGDMCSDTNPTVMNTECRDPDSSKTNCGSPLRKKTPFRNYMGYANGSCVDEFTPQQVARMHCYIDQDYQSWQTNAKPSFVPLPPRITAKEGNVIKLSWIPPLGSGGKNAKNLCNECEENNVLEQYASMAASPVPSYPTGRYAPHQATGVPDAVHCRTSALCWRPDTGKVPLYIELGFKQAVVPTSLTIWAPEESDNAFSDIRLYFTDDSFENIGGGTAQCDSPYTRPLYVKKKVNKVRIYVSRKGVCIDAVKLTSEVNHPNCSTCKPLRYIITRNPPFASGSEVTVLTTRYEDRNLGSSGRYEYRVRAMTKEGLSGPFSPPLIYKPERGFCGDGKIDKGEMCDDGNVRDGDGCNVQCQMEDVFRCDGRPSLCYRHDGDGVCEDFEKKTSIKDCGFYTPDGFKDQWVYSAVANSNYEYGCSENVVIGPPKPDLKCQSFVQCKEAWSPTTTGDSYKQTDLWIRVSFQRPAIASAIIVYFGYLSQDRATTIKFVLMDSKKQEKMSIEHIVSTFCKENPISVKIHHDMTKPFFKTQHIKMIFNSIDVGIAAVSLRSPRRFDPVELQNCRSGELFDPTLQKCHSYECNIPECSKLSVKNSLKIKCKTGKRQGDICIVECRKGFTPRKAFQAICNGGKWLVDGEPPQCIPVNCGTPDIRNAKPDCPDGTTYGKKCAYKCKKSTKQTGSGISPSVVCEEDGLWSEMNLFCQKICRKPGIPRNARPVSKDCEQTKSFNPGETCKYECKHGYSAAGYSQRDRFKRSCMKDGEWSGPQCLPIRCPVADRKIFDWYNCTAANKYGSICSLTCPDKKENRQVRCQGNGEWNKKIQLCATKAKCPAPAKLPKGPTIKCGTDLYAGTECQFECPDGFHPGIKNEQEDKHTHIPKTACSPMLHWYPDYRQIKCLRKCAHKSIQDGDCDGVNNNEDCWWDGGDCCDSTSQEGEAYRSSTLCGDNCHCQDPKGKDYPGSGSLPN